MMVGRVPIYLLDTNLEANHPDDRALMNKLYAGGPELRLRQEWILGVGGVRVLRAMGIDPAVWHANEGHAAFMMVERLRELIASGASFEDAVRAGPGAQRLHHPHAGARRPRRVLRSSSSRPCAGPVWEEMGIDREHVLRARRAIPAVPRPVPHDRDRDAALGPGERRVRAATARSPATSGATSGPAGPGRRCRSGTSPTACTWPPGWRARSWQLLDEHLGPDWGEPPRRARLLGPGARRSITPSSGRRTSG